MNDENAGKTTTRGTEVPLSPLEIVGDNEYMYASHVADLSELSSSASKLADADAYFREHPRARKFMRKLYGWSLWWQFRRLAQRTEDLVKKSERLWRAQLQEVRKQKPGFYVFDEAYAKQYHEQSKERLKVLCEIENSMRDLSEIHAKYADRVALAIDKLKKYEVHYQGLLIPRVNEDVLRDSEERYAQGQLLDVETFVNGLQGI